MNPDPSPVALEQLARALRHELHAAAEETRRRIDAAAGRLLAKLDRIIEQLIVLDQKIERLASGAGAAPPPVNRCRSRRRARC